MGDQMVIIKKTVMLQILFRAVGFWLLAAAAFPSFAGDILTEEERAYLKKNEPVTFVSQTMYPPFEFVENQREHTGMCIELARWIATELGFKTRFIDASFKDAQQMIQSGKADVLTSLFFSEKRDRSFEFTDTVFKVPASIFVAADRPDIKGIEDLDGKIVAMQKGDYALEYLESNHISTAVKYTRNFFEATNMVIAGKADAVIGDEQIVLYHLYSNRITDYVKKAGRPLYVGQNCMAVKEGEVILRSIINKGINRARENGVLDGIYRKWLGVRLSAPESFYTRYKIYILGISSGLILMTLLIWFWNIRLRRVVGLRTEALSKSENTLRVREAFLNTVIENIPNMIFVKEVGELRFIRINKAGEELLGYSRDNLLGKNDYDFFPQAQADFFTKKDRKVLAEGCLLDIPEEPIQTGSKGERILHTKKIPVLDDDGNPQYLLGISEDITERLNAEKARKLSEERLAAAIEVVDEGFVIYDSEDRLVMHNHKFKDMYKEISHVISVGRQFEDIVREGAQAGIVSEAAGREDELIAKRMFYHRSAGGYAEFKLKNGRWIKASERKTRDGGTVGFHVDITDIKQSEEHIRASLKEKETLLKEIHHRVKNNMQVVSSLLSLQAMKQDNGEITDAFIQAQSRVQSMALVHEILYRSDDLTKIDLQLYLESLTMHLFQAFACTGRIEMNISAENVGIGIDHAVPCGLIITELLTNSLKYAFPSGAGSIKIETVTDETDTVRMTIADNGIGLPQDFDPSKAGSLGLGLVIELIEDQLEGSWQLENKGGTRWIMHWKQ